MRSQVYAIAEETITPSPPRMRFYAAGNVGLGARARRTEATRTRVFGSGLQAG